MRSVRTPDLLQLVDVLAADLDDVDAAGAQHGHARGRLGHLEEHQALEVGRGPPVVLHRLVDDAVAAHVLDEFPRPGPTGLALGRLFSDALDVLLGLDEGRPRRTAPGSPCCQTPQRACSKRTVRVCGSSTSMLLMSRNSGASELAEPSLAMEAKVNLTSSAVISPGRRGTGRPCAGRSARSCPPSSTSQRSASIGASSPVLGSRVSRFSIMGLSTTSSAPDDRAAVASARCRRSPPPP